MPYIQPNAGNIFGAMPIEGIPGHGQTALYAVSSSEATAILPGDVIVRTSLGGGVRAAVTADASPVVPIVGAAANALTTAEFALGTLNLLVYDDQLQYFAMSATTSASMTLAMVGQNVVVIATATGTGIPSTLVGRSKMAIGVAGSSAGVFRVVGLHPIETYSSNPTGALKWIVRQNPTNTAILTT